MSKAYTPFSRAGRDLLEYKFDANEVKKTFVELYPLWQALNVTFTIAYVSQLELTEAELFAFYLFGFLTGDDYEGAPTGQPLIAWDYAMEKLGWVVGEAVEDE